MLYIPYTVVVLSGCVILKTQGLSLFFKHYWDHSTLFGQISDGNTWYLRYWVHSSELGVPSISFREYGVPDFESMVYMVSEVMGCIVSHYPGYIRTYCISQYKLLVK